MPDFGDLVKSTTDEEKRKQVQDSFNSSKQDEKKDKKPSAYDLSSIGDAISRRFASLKKGG